jgi:hypothetical protein
MTFGFQWRRCDGVGAGCVDISGATSASYQVVQADVGSTLRAVVTATNGSGSSSASSVATSVVTGAQPPLNTVPPSISGAAQVGSTLSASVGSWSGSQPIAYAYRWQRCSGTCVDIASATASTYVVLVEDLGATLRVAVTGSNTVGSSEAFSAETGTVGAAPVSPVFVAGASQNVGSSTTFVLVKPVGASAGDVLLGWVATDTVHALTAPPSGWAQLGTTQDDGTDSSLSVFWRVVQAGDPANWAGSFASLETGISGVVAYRGVDQVAPVDVFAQGRSAHALVSTTGSITPSGEGRAVLALFGGDPGSSTRSGSPDTSPAATERLDALNGAAGFVYAEDLTQTFAAPISLDVTWDAADSSAYFILALRAP